MAELDIGCDKLTVYVSTDAMQDMSSEVVDSNPYSRLMALQRMGIVDNYERIRDYSIAIVVSTAPAQYCFGTAILA
jgi:hypothetical protein